MSISESIEPDKGQIKELALLFQSRRYNDVLKLIGNFDKKYQNSHILLKFFALCNAELKNYDVAIPSFERLVKLQPNESQTHFNLGVALKDKGNLNDAINSFQRSACIKSDNYKVFENLGSCFHAIGNLKLAFESYQTAIDLNPKVFSLYDNLGEILLQSGKSDEAVNEYERALGVNSEWFDSYIKIANIHQLNENYVAAEFYYNLYIKYVPCSAEAFCNLGMVYRKIGDIKKAVKFYLKAISLKDIYPEAYYNLGNAQKALGNFDAAAQNYEIAIRIRPAYSEAHNNMGLVYLELNNKKAAMESFNRAIETSNASVDAYINIGNLFKDEGNLEEAIIAYNKALDEKSDSAIAYNNIALALQAHGECHLALGHYERAIAIDPNYPDAHQNIALCYFMVGDFRSAWDHYEYRWKVASKSTKPLVSNRPEWQGEPDARVLLWAEQGIGDEIMFMSVVPEIFSRSNELIIQMDARLITLFQRSFGDKIEMYSSTKVVNESNYDFQISMGAALKFFRSKNSDFEEASYGYLKVDLKRVQTISKTLCVSPKKLVGISWDSKNPKTGSMKSCDLVGLLSVIDPNSYELVNLQYGDVIEQINRACSRTGHKVNEISTVDNLTDIDGLATIISMCDMVVTIDNTTAHVAGALGKETHLLLHYAADWRWQKKRTDSLWYKSVKIYRQHTWGDWEEPLVDLKKYMEKYAVSPLH